MVLNLQNVPLMAYHFEASVRRDVLILLWNEMHHFSGGAGNSHQRGKRVSTQTDGGNRRQARALACDEDLLCLWHSGFHHLHRLQGVCDQGVFRQLLPAHVRRDLRHAE